MDILKVKELHKHSMGNEVEIMASGVCGCFYCGRIFKPSDVRDFIVEKNKSRTAICPYCGIDSVIGSACHVEITSELLKELHSYWFNIE